MRNIGAWTWEDAARGRVIGRAAFHDSVRDFIKANKPKH